MKCAEVALQFVEEHDTGDYVLYTTLVDMFKKCEDFPKPKEPRVFEWVDSKRLGYPDDYLKLMCQGKKFKIVATEILE
jgi:hypothetical protein